jgi:hypothetical protein
MIPLASRPLAQPESLQLPGEQNPLGLAGRRSFSLVRIARIRFRVSAFGVSVRDRRRAGLRLR